jgi:gamma-glutamyl:cysteine ligase YbdK (ATP-grasp superfamily)
MSTATIETVVKMLETLSAPAQERAVEHLREYIEDLKDEAHWDRQFDRTSGKLSEIAEKAREEIAEGKAAPMDFEKL